MKIFQLYRETLMPITAEQAWDFFSSADNLARITPPEVKFETLTQLTDNRIYEGMIIHYRLRPLLNIPIIWQTEIGEVNAPYKFMDKQLKGPYALWEHTHTFIAIPGGVKMTDEVKYALPMSWLGILAHTLIVRRKIRQIFQFRKEALKQLFGAIKI